MLRVDVGNVLLLLSDMTDLDETETLGNRVLSFLQRFFIRCISYINCHDENRLCETVLPIHGQKECTLLRASLVCTE